jgi:hypothetical protein
MSQLAMMALKRIGNRAQSDPEDFQKYMKLAAKVASNPTVQQKALNFGRKGIQYIQDNPQLKSRALQALNLGSESSLEQRVSKLEEQMGMIMGMARSYGIGGKTRKQKRKQRKTRRHKH